jgi:8-oxo-dGTP pyrophosphatase MutT (NUDIX family)
VTPLPSQDLVARLQGHRGQDEAEVRDVRRVLEFVARHPDPFDRRISEGHLTGSAFVVARSGARILLLHHRKLDRWLQPGGHADQGETSGEAVALREAREETGLEALHLHPTAPRPLDVDVHQIPARPGEPAHLHLDLRYLVVAEDAVLVRAEEEAADLKWFGWNELDALGLDPGLQRGLAKVLRYFGPGVT